MTEQLALIDTPKLRMTEAALLFAVRTLCRLTHWRCYHTHDSRRSEPGFPDLCMVSATQQRLVFAELKDDKGKLRPDQVAWLTDLNAAGMETAVWRPADLPTVIPAVLRGRPTRWSP